MSRRGGSEPQRDSLGRAWPRRGGGLRRQLRLGFPPIDVPTLLLWGEEDVALARYTTYGTEAFAPRLTTRYLPGVSHWVQQDATDVCNAALRAFLAPRMATHGLTSVREYFRDLLRYTNQDTAPAITCPSYVTDNETDTVSLGQGKALFDRLTCPKEFRLFTKAEGAEGHCEGMAPIIFWTAAFDWLDHLLT